LCIGAFSHMQVGLVLCQGYVPENIVQIEHIIPIQNSVFPGGYEIDSLILCSDVYTASGHMDLKSIYVLYIQYTYISI